MRHEVTALLVRLAGKSECLPTSLLIKDVDIGDDRDPWASGGFADVFRGLYKDKTVALKRLRVPNEEKAIVHPVSEFRFSFMNFSTDMFSALLS